MNRLSTLFPIVTGFVWAGALVMLSAMPSVAGAEPLLLTNWTVEQFSTGGGGVSMWMLQPGDTSVEQKNNSDSSIFLSDFTLDHSTSDGFTATVNARDTDDDQIGMVFGYQNRSNFYLFQWRASDNSLADDGMHLRRITAVGDPSLADLEGPQETGTGTASMFMFAQNDLLWSPEVDYQFIVTFNPVGFDFEVTDGVDTLASWSVTDLVFTAGNVGFYNSSQPSVLYSGSVGMSGGLDTDGDGTPDATDNCTLVANGPTIPDAGGNVQLDTNGDGIGNACDPDLNNDNVVDFGDLPAFQAAFFSSPQDMNWNPDADINGDDVVDFGDLPTVQSLFFQAPGPSGPLP